MENNQEEEYYNTQPLPVTIASVFVLCITVWSGIRAWTAITDWELLSRFRATPNYTFATGILWLIVGIALTVALLKGSRIAPTCGLILSVSYVLWYWIDRLVIQTSPTTNITFSIVVSIIGLVIFNANLFWPSSRAFFEETP